MDFQTAYNLVVPVAEKKYGVEVRISAVVNPNTGDFDGQAILIETTRTLRWRCPKFTPHKFASRWSF